MKKIYIMLAIAAGLAAVGCSQDDYKASVTELRFVGINPSSGYAGDIVKILGRNFSTEFGENVVLVGDAQAQIIEITKDELMVIMPDNPLGKYVVSVTTPKGTVEGSLFEYKQKPAQLWTVSTFAGSGSDGTVDEIGTSASFSFPEGLSWSSNGQLYVCQRNVAPKAAIRKLNPKSGTVTTVSLLTGFDHPWGGGFDSQGNFYAAAKSKNKIVKIAPDGTYAEYPSGAALNSPMYAVSDSQDNVWIASRNNHAVYKTKDGVCLETYVGDKYFPTCIAIDSKDRAIFASSQLFQLLMVENGEVKVIAGNGTKANKENFPSGLASGNPLEASIGAIEGICIGKDGAIYMTDVTTFTVMKLVPDETGNYASGTLSLLAGQPFSNSVVNGTSDKAAFFYPSGIAVSDDGKEIFVTEPTKHIVRKLSLK